MKLLPPKLLNEKLQEQKRSEVSAGLFLAKKVDALREELQETKKIHDETIANLSKEMELFVAKQTSERGAILKEISELTEQRRLLQIPLDNEWKNVNQSKEYCIKKEESLVKWESKNLQKEKELTQKDIRLSKREETLKDNEQRTDRFLSSADLIKQEADDILREARENEIEIKKTLQVRVEEIEKREKTIAYREIDAENKYNNALAKEETNRKETLHIESKQRQLKIALDILKNANSIPNNSL